eukprot:TRINITY_DN57_c0_g1_i7.p1 TRINITY_DN57_c0_g1~~TRINITY_DN57_c0_g1_i7.p1  ORF type:complete len:515 (+),score=159.38 TRINITY_DN57_c0_g1_i7:68-1612(+)
MQTKTGLLLALALAGGAAAAAPARCTDLRLSGGGVWVDKPYGTGCTWYGAEAKRCEWYGSRYRNEHTAGEACCVCGGGMRTDGQQTPVPTPPPPPPPTSSSMSAKVLAKSHLVAFWDFETKGPTGNFVARSNVDNEGAEEAEGLYPVWLRRGHDGSEVGAPGYTEATWPSSHPVTATRAGGPFNGKGLNVKGTTLFATVERKSFDRTPLDISGADPFSLVAWVWFPAGSNRHHIAGIWDEGTWGKYSGQRQYALFRIGRYGHRLFGHISATGAASYPQAGTGGDQYARIRALNGAHLSEGEWHMLAMTHDGAQAQSSQDGVSTPNSYEEGEEWVEERVYKDAFNPVTNPKEFSWGVFHPLRFVVKFNGYDVTADQVNEHYVRVDLKSPAAQRTITYGVKAPSLPAIASRTYRVTYTFKRGGALVAQGSGSFDVRNNAGTAHLSPSLVVEADDRLQLELTRNGARVGSVVEHRMGPGAAFSFGRILGDGTTMVLGGVAMYNRVLSEAELQDLASF